MHRRSFLMGSTVAGVAASGFSATGVRAQTARRAAGARPRINRLDPAIDELQRRTFDWFVKVTDRSTGLTPDRWPTESFCSVAAVGFALGCWPVGVERGWMTRAEARERTLITLRTFWTLPQGPEPTGVVGHKGFFYHFLDMDSGYRFGQTELSTVDTALFIGGALFAARYFNGDHPEEGEIRDLAQKIYERIEWDWAVVRPNRISMGWHPETGFIPHDWWIYNEGMLLLLLAIGSPTHPVPPAVWHEWAYAYEKSWTDRWGDWHLQFAPIFGHQYSHMFIDFRGVQDAWMRGRSAMTGLNLDYFENSRWGCRGRISAGRRRRGGCSRNSRGSGRSWPNGHDNPIGWAGYSSAMWGLTACDGPGDFKQVIDGREREFFSYSARGPGERDDGTIAPTAAAASIAFAPEIVVPCVKAMQAWGGDALYTEYGFLDSFNPTLKERDGPLQHGRIVPGLGWINGDYLGIDQGPIVIMTENHRSGLLWRHMHSEPNLRRALELSGFTGGWLDA